MQLIKYSNIVPLGENTLERIHTVKSLREQWGGENHHEEQCATVPDTIIPNVSGVHIVPCYKRFTLFISRAKNKDFHASESGREKSARVRYQCSYARALFSKHCIVCKYVKKD